MTQLVISSAPHRAQPVLLTADSRNAVALVNPDRTFCPESSDIYAALIVRVVNAHADLVAALRDCTEALAWAFNRVDSQGGEPYAYAAAAAALDDACAALAKAEG